MVERLEARCRELAIEPPTEERVERIVRAALRAHEDRFHSSIYDRLSPIVRGRLNALLGSAEADRAADIDMIFSRTLDARYGIRCNCICPGAIETPLLVGSATPQMIDKFKEVIPLGRLGKPEGMANVVLFLASELASFVTGAAFVADGGQTAKTGSPSFLPE
jgi:Enoyl-(Acyl carrier protein) reductase